MRTSLEVTAERVLFLGKRGSVALPEGEEIEPEDLPFE